MTTELERCMEMAAPLLPEFSEAWQLAMQTYRKYEPAFTAEHDDTTAANCIRSHMWVEIDRRFRGRPGFALLRLKGLNVLLYRDLSVWRFKRVDRHGRHSNYQTDQQRDFDDQKPFPEIPPPAVRLTSGYQPDASGQAIERVIVARPIGRSMQWAAQVNVVDNVASWIEITPKRFAGTERFERKRGTGEAG
jgi:hypothetical protein